MNIDGQIATLESFNGYHEGPNNANDFITWQTDGVWSAAPWCDAFAQYGAFVGGGFQWPEYSQWGIKGDSYCPYTVRRAQQLGVWVAKDGTPQRGWQVLFSWGRNGVADHIGTVLEARDDGMLVCIEGNKADAVRYTLRDRTYVTGFVVMSGDTVDVPPQAPAVDHPADTVGSLQWPVLSTHIHAQYPTHTKIVQDCESMALADGDYGPATRTAVIGFQRRYGLMVDGVTGLYTATMVIQIDLAYFGYDIGDPDGDYGPRTTSAVMQFQSDSGLNPDGVFGNDSTAALFNRIGL